MHDVVVCQIAGQIRPRADSISYDPLVSAGQQGQVCQGFAQLRRCAGGVRFCGHAIHQTASVCGPGALEVSVRV
jgi:hypothetical protein